MCDGNVSDAAMAERLFEELGPLLDPAAIVYDETQSQWTVAIDEDTRIDVGYYEADDELIFALDLGEIPDESVERVHELLLRFSFVWRETGGLHAGLDGEGRPFLMYKHTLQQLDVQQLQTLMSNLAAHREMWAELIGRSATEDPDPDGGESPPPFTGVRV